MRVLFMGTPDFAVPCLERIAADGHELCGVFTQPDKPFGRRQILTPPPVKTAALRMGVPVWQPAALRDGGAEKIIRGLEPDVIAVTAYGKILPQSILDIPPEGCINVHASLLPAYRGAAPMQWAIINGEKKTGVTTMYMAKGCDTGDMILSQELAIAPECDFGTLHDAMMPLGAELLSRTLRLAQLGGVPRTPQDDSKASSAPMIDMAVRTIDFRKTAAQVHDLIRGLSPAPCAVSVLDGVPVKIFSSHLSPRAAHRAPGATEECEGGIAVACGGGTELIITRLQARGGRPMAAADYLNGHRHAASAGFGPAV